MTRDEVEALVAGDYARLKGKLIKAHAVECCNDSDTSTMYLTEPVVLRIDDGTPLDQGIIRWMGNEWCDPAYDVTLVESTPEADAWLADGGYHVSWIYGPSRSTAGAYDKPRFVVLAR